MKKIITIVTMLLFASSILFINLEEVQADYVYQTKQSFECIYDDGSMFTLTHPLLDKDEDGTQTYSTVVNRDSYNIVGSQSQQSSSTGAIIFVNSGTMIGEKHHCSPYVIIGQVKENKRDDNESPTSFVKFTFSDGVEFEESEVTIGNHGWWFWAETGATQANNNKVQGKLKSERINIDNTNPDETLYFKKYGGDQDYKETDAYININKYHDMYGDFYVIENESIATVADIDFDALKSMEEGSSIYINDPSRITLTTSTGNAQYDYEYPRFNINLDTKRESDGCTIRYVKVLDGPNLHNDRDDELCDKIMPETSKVLRNVIKTLQLLVPLLLIVLSGLDLAKIIFTSAKLEEEIPKQRKRLIIRMIVAAFFFFTPLVVNLTIDMIKDSGGDNTDQIKKIGCLFE